MTMDPTEQALDEASEHADRMWSEGDSQEGLEFNPDAPNYRIDARGDEVGSEPPSDDLAAQMSFLAGAPEWAIAHPAVADVANVTFIEADELRWLVERMLEWDELKTLRGVPFEVRWRTKTKPVRRTRLDEEVILAGVGILPPFSVWEAGVKGVEDFPRYVVYLHWAHFEERRKAGDDGLRYIHHEEVQRWIHHALMGLEMQGAEIKKVGADVQGFAATVERFKMPRVGGAGMHALRRQLKLLPDDSGDE